MSGCLIRTTLLFQADRLLALLMTGRVCAEAARDLAAVLEDLERVAVRDR